ncbi:MAG: methyltransferase domain-containing protein [Stigonema ocellatum SAG 48.90 = DSM 106950]|nr:methyltransferase domain-containing protein [Stigonema ocellatum SAG 48.90 = DSM 106950]
MDSKHHLNNYSVEQVKNKYKQIYDLINSDLSSNIFGNYSFFLNYGYIADHNPQYSNVELPKQELNKSSIKLILEVIGDCDIRDGEILDIGCGRGGTSFTINKYFGVKRIIGLDQSSNAISFCKQKFENYRLQFLEGDAENLPFSNNLFDIITNIESSCNYPHILNFYTEVYRVLRMGGYFLYSDIFLAESMDHTLNVLDKIGFVLEIDRDITNNVLLSMNESAARHLAAYSKDKNEKMLNNFVALPGSKIYEDLKNRKMLYKIFRFRKEHGKIQSLNQEQALNYSNSLAIEILNHS